MTTTAKQSKITATAVGSQAIGSPLLVADGYDSLLVAVNAKADTDGYTKPSSAQLDLISALLTDGLPTAMRNISDSFKIWAQDGSSDYATLNFIDPDTHQNVLVNNPTWTSNQGFSGASGKAVRSGVDLTNGALNIKEGSSGTISFYLYSVGSYGNYAYGTGSDTYLDINSANDFRIKFGSSAQVGTAGITYGVGVLITVIRTSANTVKVYEDSTLKNTLSLTADATSGELIWLAFNASGIAPGDYTIGLTYIGGDIEAYISDFSSAVNTYFAAL